MLTLDLFQSGIDRLLIYITLYITECLKKLQKCANKNQAQQEMYTLAISRFDIPGDAGFPLNSVYPKPASANEAGESHFHIQHIFSWKFIFKENPSIFHRSKNFHFVISDLLRQYLTQIRQETGNRLIEKVFSTPDGKPSKWWTCFAKKKFMEHSLSGFGQWLHEFNCRSSQKTIKCAQKISTI